MQLRLRLGPRYVTAGIWKGIRIERWTVRIDGPHPLVTLAPDHSSATINAAVTLSGASSIEGCELEVSVLTTDGDVVDAEDEAYLRDADD